MSTPLSPKVTSATLSGALAVVLVWGAETAGVELDAKVAGSLVVLLMAGAAYFKRDPLRADYDPKHDENLRA